MTSSAQRVTSLDCTETGGWYARGQREEEQVGDKDLDESEGQTARIFVVRAELTCGALR